METIEIIQFSLIVVIFIIVMVILLSYEGHDQVKGWEWNIYQSGLKDGIKKGIYVSDNIAEKIARQDAVAELQRIIDYMKLHAPEDDSMIYNSIMTYFKKIMDSKDRDS